MLLHMVRKVPAARTDEPEARQAPAAMSEHLESRTGAEAEPLLQIIGLAEDPAGPDDVAEEHDHYLYGTPKRG